MRKFEKEHSDQLQSHLLIKILPQKHLALSVFQLPSTGILFTLLSFLLTHWLGKVYHIAELSQQCYRVLQQYLQSFIVQWGKATQQGAFKILIVSIDLCIHLKSTAQIMSTPAPLHKLSSCFNSTPLEHHNVIFVMIFLGPHQYNHTISDFTVLDIKLSDVLNKINDSINTQGYMLIRFD